MAKPDKPDGESLVLTRPIVTNLGRQWEYALRTLTIRHPDPACAMGFELTDGDPPSLFVWATVRDSREPDKMRKRQAIHTVALACWPGLRGAHAFLSVMWTGYMTHESLECCHYADGTRPLDPHRAPFEADWAFRRAAPAVLTLDSLRTSLAVILPGFSVDALCQGAE